MSDLLEVVVLSGKGGTGKTSVTAAFAHLAATGARPLPTVLADLDVDASNLELVLDPIVRETHGFSGGQVAIIDQSACSACGTCAQVCRFDAIVRTPAQGYQIDPIACEGCAACVFQCPEDAIRLEPQLAGQWYRSDSRFGSLFHARLRPAQESSGKLVKTVREHARRAAWETGCALLLLDGPPGIGCPVISAATGTDLALVVTEPSVSGIHDLERVLQTTRHFDLPTWVCINKADLHPAGTERIQIYCREHDIAVMGQIPFDLTITEAMLQGLPVTLYRPGSPAAAAIRDLWDPVLAVAQGAQ